MLINDLPELRQKGYFYHFALITLMSIFKLPARSSEPPNRQLKKVLAGADRKRYREPPNRQLKND